MGEVAKFVLRNLLRVVVWSVIGLVVACLVFRPQRRRVTVSVHGGTPPIRASINGWPMRIMEAREIDGSRIWWDNSLLPVRSVTVMDARWRRLSAKVSDEAYIHASFDFRDSSVLLEVEP